MEKGPVLVMLMHWAKAVTVTLAFEETGLGLGGRMEIWMEGSSPSQAMKLSCGSTS
jgi:hypothetical protein